MVICTDCGLEEARRKYCTSCGKKRRSKRTARKVIEWRRNTKRRLVELHGGKCSRCGYAKCLRALQFHHIDPTQKSFMISRSETKAFQLMIAEANKCELLCSNCHAEIEDEKFLQTCARNW